MRKWYKLPLILVGVHTTIVLVYWLWSVMAGNAGEVEAGWEYVFGIIDFTVYYTVGVPQFISEIGVRGGVADALWFGTTGGIQWFVFGYVFSLIRKRNMVKPKIQQVPAQRDLKN